MPLPENWCGVFWKFPSIDVYLLVDRVSPEDFIQFVITCSDDPVFLILGGCLDLRRNGLRERSDAIMAAAKVKWPEFKWDAVDGLIDEVVAFLPPLEAGTPSKRMRKMLHIGFEALADTARGIIPLPDTPTEP